MVIYVNFSIIFGKNLPTLLVRKAVSIGLSLLLVYHTLAYMLVCVSAWWQAEHDLSEKLSVYRTVDSMVEFEIPLSDTFDASRLPHITEEGFSYRGSYYAVISIETRADKLFITGMESKNRSFWSDDLLAFLENHIDGATDSHQKANQFLKFLLKEYPPAPRVVFSFRLPYWRDAVRIPEGLFVLASRALPIHSPPPER